MLSTIAEPLSPQSRNIQLMLEEEIHQLEGKIQLKRALLEKVHRIGRQAHEATQMLTNEISSLQQLITIKRSLFTTLHPTNAEEAEDVVQVGGGRVNINRSDQAGPSQQNFGNQQQPENENLPSQQTLRRTLRRRRTPQNDQLPARLSNFSNTVENVDDEPIEDWPLAADDGAEHDQENLAHFFTIDNTDESESISRNTKTEKCSLRLHNIEDAQRPDLIVEKLIAELFKRVIGDRPPPKFIQLQIQFPEADRPFFIPLRPPEQNTPAVVAAALDHLYRQSGDIFDLRAGTIETKVIAVWPLQIPRGRGACNDQEHRVTRRVRSMVTVRNPNDRYCLAKAIIIGLAARNYLPDREARFREVCEDDAKQTRRALRLMEQAGVPLDRQFYEIRHARLFQRDIDEVYGEQEVRIVIFSKEHNNQPIFKGYDLPARFNLCLYLENRHYNFIAQPRQLFQANQYCIDCERGIKRRTFHPKSCVAVCRLCYRFGRNFPCVFDHTGRKCEACQFIFPTQNCYDHHKARGVRNGNPICNIRFMCRRCGGIVYADQYRHKCSADPQQEPCRHCSAIHTMQFPYCYIQPLDFHPNDAEEQPEENGNGDADENSQVDSNQVGVVEEDGEELVENQQVLDNEEGEEQNVEVMTQEEKPLRYIWFDIETTQTTRMIVSERVVRKHVPILVMADVLCERCIQAGYGISDHNRRSPDCVCGVFNQQLPAICDRFGNNPRRLVFKSFDAADPSPVDAFLNFLLHMGVCNIRTIVYSHNGGKFDTHLCLERMYQRNLRLRMITTGLKIYALTVKGRHIRETIFKDSLNFFLCGLDKLPKTFEIQALVADKPHFPHSYITLDNMDIDSPSLPALHFYEPDKKKPEDRERLLQWYRTNAATTPFMLRRDLVEYCANDVAILREACLAFRRLFLEVAQLDPFSKSVTIAGLAMTTFRKHDLPPNTLINLPEGGFDKAENQSAIALKFMRLFEMQNNCQVQTQQWSLGEARVQDSGYRLDGLWRRGPGQADLAIEFMGCYFHGCNACYKDRSVILAGGRTAEELWQRTQRRLHELRYVHLFELCVVWECEFLRMLRRDPAIRRQYNSIFIATPLDPRQDAYRGGRTEPFVFHYGCAADEEIICIDINSLYPNEMKKGAYPTGLPAVLKREKLPLNTLPWRTPVQNPFRGLLKCRILAPTNLRYPLLPYRTRDGVLTFALCATCADEHNQQPCTHINQKRTWVTAYTHAELNRALELGYMVTDLFEVWHWTEWAEMAQNNGLFTGYVNRFLKIKAEASGLPSNCPDTAAYARQYREDEGIELDENRIRRNEGLRFISKVMLNSLYGKFGQRPFKTTVHTTTTPRAFHQLLENETHESIDIDHVSEFMDRVVTRKKADFCTAPRTNCLPVAIYVTSYARLRLYQYMETAVNMGVKLLYCDTDSIFYAKKVGSPCVPEGDCLGEMKREYAERKMIEIICAGPKNYAFVHADPKKPEDIESISKIRGFRLTYEAAQIVNYHRMKALIFAAFNIEEDETLEEIDPPNPLIIESTQFLRTKRSDVYTKRSAKQWKPVYNKGRVIPGMEAVPFGYRPDDAPIFNEEEEEQEEIDADPDDGHPRIPCNIQ